MRAIGVLLALALAGCDPPPRMIETPPPVEQPAADRPTDAWIGRWIGTEGTYLDIAPQGQGYALTINELDGLGTYAGEPQGAAIVFTRRGVEERLTAGTGEETGLKHLLERSNCLVIRYGEGFCR